MTIMIFNYCLMKIAEIYLIRFKCIYLSSLKLHVERNVSIPRQCKVEEVFRNPALDIMVLELEMTYEYFTSGILPIAESMKVTRFL